MTFLFKSTNTFKQNRIRTHKRTLCNTDELAYDKTALANEPGSTLCFHPPNGYIIIIEVVY